MWLDELRKMKEKTGKTIREIAEESGLPEPTLEKIFSGATKDPKLTTIQQLVHYMGFTLDDLTAKEKAPAQQEPDGPVSLNESTDLLIELGYIKRGEILSDADLAFLTHISGLLAAWFSSNRP